MFETNAEFIWILWVIQSLAFEYKRANLLLCIPKITEVSGSILPFFSDFPSRLFFKRHLRPSGGAKIMSIFWKLRGSPGIQPTNVGGHILPWEDLGWIHPVSRIQNRKDCKNTEMKGVRIWRISGRKILKKEKQWFFPRSCFLGCRWYEALRVSYHRLKVIQKHPSVIIIGERSILLC